MSFMLLYSPKCLGDSSPREYVKVPTAGSWKKKRWDEHQQAKTMMYGQINEPIGDLEKNMINQSVT